MIKSRHTIEDWIFFFFYSFRCYFVSQPEKLIHSHMKLHRMIVFVLKIVLLAPMVSKLENFIVSTRAKTLFNFKILSMCILSWILLTDAQKLSRKRSKYDLSCYILLCHFESPSQLTVCNTFFHTQAIIKILSVDWKCSVGSAMHDNNDN